MKMCKKCSTCIGNTICEILTYPNNGQCDIFIKLVEEKLKSPNKQSTPLPFELGYCCRRCGETFSGEALPLLHRC